MTAPPTKAVVLAAGLGTRMLPLTATIPKPLLPLCGVPMLEHVLRAVRAWGVRNVLINCHHRAADILAFAAANPVPGLHLDLSYEPDVLGTGGVLHRAAWFFDRDPFWMLNADVAMDLDPAPLLNAGVGGRALAALWMLPDRGPRTVEVSRGRVRNFRSPTPGAPGTVTFSGLHLLSPDVLRYIPEGFSTIIAAYEKARSAGRTIRSVLADPAYWADIGTPDQFLEAHRDITRRHAIGAPGGNLLIPSRRVAVPVDATVHNSVVLPGATVGPSAVLRNAIVAPGVTVTGAASGIVMPASTALDPIEQRAAHRVVGTLDRAILHRSIRSGSARTYTRIQKGRRSVMLVRYSRQRPENALYARHARFLARREIRVPEVLLDRPGDRLTLFEDVGDLALTQWVESRTDRRIESAYRSILEIVHRLHAIRPGNLTLMEPFSLRLYRWEHELFAEQFLRHQPDVASDEIAAVLRELGRVARVLQGVPQVLVHRDLQSSNVHLHRREYVLIDFQGMRMGPAAYDIASLLCDPYVSLSWELQERLRGDAPLFWEAAIQRLCQALGAFGRLSRLPGGTAFAAHVAPGLHMLQRALDHCALPMPVLRTVVGRCRTIPVHPGIRSRTSTDNFPEGSSQTTNCIA